MAVGPYCARCQTGVRLEQDGRSCSNCGTLLVTPIPPTDQRPPATDEPAPQPPPTKPRRRRTRRKTPATSKGAS